MAEQVSLSAVGACRGFGRALFRPAEGHKSMDRIRRMEGPEKEAKVKVRRTNERNRQWRLSPHYDLALPLRPLDLSSEDTLSL